MARQIIDKSFAFPIAGVNVVAPRYQQPPDTCVNCQNVRAFDSLENRKRGGIRPGLSKYNASQISGSNRIQCIDHATIVLNTAPSQTGLHVRDIRSVAVCNGVIKWFSGTTVNAATVVGNSALNSGATFILSAEASGKVYFTDGISYKVWTAANNTAHEWTASAGSLPGTNGSYVPRLIETWRSRIVLSGLRTDPHNWFMSKLGNPNDWDYSPNTTTEIQAVTGSIGVTEKLEDIVNGIVPYSEDILVFGGDHSLWMLDGDPQAGGRFNLISDNMGMAFGRAWCKDGSGNIYFLSTRGAVYRLQIGQGGGQLTPLSSGSIHSELIGLDLNTRLIRMVWNEEQQGVHLFMSPLSG